ncbi:MAG: hypothetical protein COA85_12680 [Robiginitomaculum sp.]|nr:MAG: hypothetical protein COA85_12680 [Robiginitomaculum sp.]
MVQNYNVFLLIGGLSSLVAAALHILIIVGGSGWYDFFGAGKRFSSAAAKGALWPHIITLFIAMILAVWGLYALKGAGMFPGLPLPLLRLALVGITIVYLVRGLVLVPALWLPDMPKAQFFIWSSLICLGIGMVYLLGLRQIWHGLE